MSEGSVRCRGRAKEYMNALLEHGYRIGIAGYGWHKAPPGYQE
jgi:hypothetical protein